MAGTARHCAARLNTHTGRIRGSIHDRCPDPSIATSGMSQASRPLNATTCSDARATRCRSVLVHRASNSAGTRQARIPTNSPISHDGPSRTTGAAAGMATRSIEQRQRRDRPEWCARHRDGRHGSPQHCPCEPQVDGHAEEHTAFGVVAPPSRRNRGDMNHQQRRQVPRERQQRAGERWSIRPPPQHRRGDEQRRHINGCAAHEQIPIVDHGVATDSIR